LRNLIADLQVLTDGFRFSNRGQAAFSLREVDMKRREFVEKLGVGSAVALVSGGAIAGLTDSGTAARETEVPRHAHGPIRDPEARTTVTFGAWRTDQALDRYPNVSPAASNAHVIAPFEATIKAGGTVEFAITGLHQIVIYAPGMRSVDVNATLTRPTTGTPPGVALINDPTNRVYAGLDPSTQSRDRVETVQFLTPGRYLVICGVQTHFVNDEMFSWIKVRPNDDEG
jgi:plastocyanin